MIPTRELESFHSLGALSVILSGHTALKTLALFWNDIVFFFFSGIKLGDDSCRLCIESVQTLCVYSLLLYPIMSWGLSQSQRWPQIIIVSCFRVQDPRV